METDIYTAEMGNPPTNDDMMSVEMLQNKRKPMPKGMPMPKAMPKRPPSSAMSTVPRSRPDPADAGIFTADKGIAPPIPDEGPTASLRPKTDRQKKAAKDIKSAMGMKKGGSVSSASKRADGCATKGKTKGRMI